MLTAELRNIIDLPGHRRRGTNIHRRHLLGHGPSWPRPYSGVSDVPRHTPVSDVPKQDNAEFSRISSRSTDVSDPCASVGDVITVDDVGRITAALPRSYEVVVRDQIKFRVGRIVYVAFSRDETVMGVAFPKEERAAMVAAEPDKFMLPRKSDMRYNWIHVGMDAIDLDELRELVIDAWRMCVPKKVAAQVN